MKRYSDKRYVPVALVLETETEYHDVFRQIMLALFDLIRVPCELFKISNTNVPAPSDTNLNTQKDQNNKEQSNVDKLIAGNNRLIESKKIAFADLVAHIAFLKTLPAPPFNSIFNVHMLPVVINN
jgi:hypothetical protein